MHVNSMWITALRVNIGWILLHSIRFSWNNDIQILGKPLARYNSLQENHHHRLNICSVEVFTPLFNKFKCINFLGGWRDRCVLYNDYNQNIKKRNRSDIQFPSLSYNTLAAINRAKWPCLVWLLPLRTHSLRQLWNSLVRFKWRHAQRCRAFPKINPLSWRHKYTQRNGEHLLFEHHISTDKLKRR